MCGYVRGERLLFYTFGDGCFKSSSPGAVHGSVGWFFSDVISGVHEHYRAANVPDSRNKGLFQVKHLVLA